MITILEGPDCGGKTTFTSYLISQGFGQVEHHGPYPNEKETAPHYFGSLQRARRKPLIMDRAWHSEPIYGSAYRNGNDRVGIAFRRMLERAALACGGVVVFHLPPLSRCLEDWKKRKPTEYLKTESAVRNVYQQYKSLAADYDALPSYIYDYTKTRPGEALEGIEDIRPTRNLGAGTGAWRPRESILVIGAPPGRGHSRADAYEVPDYPFTSFRPDGCSAWLAEQLEIARVPERWLYWIGPYTDGVRTSPAFLRHLKPRAIMALGLEAQRWCNENSDSIRCDTYPITHPQYHKRFHPNGPYELGYTIKEIRS